MNNIFTISDFKKAINELTNQKMPITKYIFPNSLLYNLDYSITKEKAPIYYIGKAEPLTFTYKREIMITYKWPDGTCFTGTLDNLKLVSGILVKTIDYNNIIVPKGYYLSSYQKLILIKEMNTVHIKNTIKKKITNFNKTINYSSDSNLETLYLNWIQNNQIIQDLFEELKSRGESL